LTVAPIHLIQLVPNSFFSFFLLALGKEEIKHVLKYILEVKNGMGVSYISQNVFFLPRHVL
jgi:hypothetical protein